MPFPVYSSISYKHHNLYKLCVVNIMLRMESCGASAMFVHKSRTFTWCVITSSLRVVVEWESIQQSIRSLCNVTATGYIRTNKLSVCIHKDEHTTCCLDSYIYASLLNSDYVWAQHVLCSFLVYAAYILHNITTTKRTYYNNNQLAQNTRSWCFLKILCWYFICVY